MDRRPLATRETGWANRLAQVVALTGLSPNAISSLGLVFACLAGVAFALTQHEAVPHWAGFTVGAIGVQMRLLANMLDGMVAQLIDQSSPLGELFNEVPDRFEDAVILIGLGYAIDSTPWLGFLAAVLALLTAYIRAQCAVSGAPQDFGGPIAKPQRMFLVTVGAVVAIFWSPAPTVCLAVIAFGTFLTAILRLRRAAKFLTQQDLGPSE